MLAKAPVIANLLDVLAAETGTGPIWSTEADDLDCTFVSWEQGGGVAVHVNQEVDVLMMVLSGDGVARIGGDEVKIKLGSVLLIPKGVERSIEAASTRLAYLNVHKRRKRLMPAKANGKPWDRRLSSLDSEST